jgi:hypothetical protein
MLPRRWHIVFIEYGFDRALRNTGFTVDAFIGMDVDHLGILIKAITRANLQASLIFAAFAWFSHDHRHNGDPQVRIVGNKRVPKEVRIWTEKRTSIFKKFRM